MLWIIIRYNVTKIHTMYNKAIHKMYNNAAVLCLYKRKTDTYFSLYHCLTVLQIVQSKSPLRPPAEFFKYVGYIALPESKKILLFNWTQVKCSEPIHVLAT